MEYEEMKEAVDKFFGDTSRTQQETRDGLEELIEEIRFLISTLGQ